MYQVHPKRLQSAVSAPTATTDPGSPPISKPLFRELLNTGDRICCIYNSQPPIQCISEGSSVTGRAGKIDIRYCVSPWNSNTA